MIARRENHKAFLTVVAILCVGVIVLLIYLGQQTIRNSHMLDVCQQALGYGATCVKDDFCRPPPVRVEGLK